MKVFVTEDVLRHLVIKGKFDIENDSLLIETGNSFFCRGHLGAVPVEKQKNEKYCVDCYASMVGL